ncbi:MAG: M14 family metallopeptidase [Planctomycetota bacterium]
MNRPILASFIASVMSLGICLGAHAQQQITSKVDIPFNRFNDVETLQSYMFKLAEAYPSLCRVERIGTTALGRPYLAMVINNRQTGDEGTKPAMYIDGAIHANEIQAGETVLYTAWYLLSGYGAIPKITELVDRSTFYLVPLVNPDGRAEWFKNANNPHSARTGQKPVDNDGDGVADEDGPDDMDGDGQITMMWRPDPFGTHRRDPRDPNRMIPVSREPKADGTREYGDWTMAGQEGFDNDGDGRVNEDGPGGYDMNRNFPSGWEPENIQSGAGPYPLYWPETKALADWVLSKPQIAAAQAYHNAGGMILRGPGAGSRESDYPASDANVYARIQAVGAEMLPFYRPMVIYKDLYTVHGGAVNWFAEGLGIVSLTNELWTEKRIMQNGKDPSDEEDRKWNERMLFGQTNVPLHEVKHPDYGMVLVGGGTKFSSRIPPPFMMEEELHRNFAFTMFHADQMPLLRFESVETKEISPELWQVTVTVANDRLIPTRTARAAEKGIGLADTLTLTGADVVAAGTLDRRTDRTIDPQGFLPATLQFEHGVPGQASVAARFLVKGIAATPITLAWNAEKAKRIETTIKLGESTIPQAGAAK